MSNLNDKKVLGVIGGLGPIATAYFMELIIRMTDARIDQEHLDMVIYNFPSIPDRTGFILGTSQDSPLPGMIQVAQTLDRQNVGVIAIPCMTGHYFYNQLQESVHTPIVNGIGETARILKENGIHKAGIMATDGSIFANLFQKELLNAGISPVIPSDDSQKKVMHLIYDNIKANLPPDMSMFRAVSRELRENGAKAIILGCTELSLIKRDYSIGPGYLDAMEVLAQQSILRCGGKLENEYSDLISR